jgi:hypothetical protein
MRKNISLITNTKNIRYCNYFSLLTKTFKLNNFAFYITNLNNKIYDYKNNFTLHSKTLIIPKLNKSVILFQ